MSAAAPIGRAARGAGALWGWALRETGAALPRGVADLGSTGRARLIALDSAGEAGPAQGARRSVFARWRHGGAPGGRAILLLNPDRVLRRTLILPAAAAGDPVQAVRLRFETLCPIPPEDAAFAVEPLGRAEDGGLRVELAIVRKAELDAAAARAAARDGDWCVAAEFGEAGAFLVFAHGAPEGRPSRWLTGMLALAGLAAAYAAVDARLSGDIARLEARSAELAASARNLQASASGSPAAERLSAYPTLAEALAALAEAEGRLPEGAALQSARLNQRSGALVLEGGGAVGFEAQEARP